MTESLQARGQDGPEILTQILNAFFAAVIEAAQKYDADILKFSGDGLWLYLPDPGQTSSLAESAQQAVRELNNRHDYLKAHPIGLHLGAEMGSVELVSFGDSRYRLELEPVGPVVAEAYACCDRAATGQIALGPELARYQAGNPIVPRSDAKKLRETSGESSAAADPAVWRYVPQSLIGRLADGGGGTVGSEYRDATVLFCHCTWDSQLFASDREFVIDRARRVMSCVQEFQGSLARIDPFKDGHKFLILFGAPVTRSDDQWRALECARQLATLNEKRFNIRVGLAHGRTFCGAVGASTRMEYTVMGSAANLAARLMSKAEYGTVLFDSKMRALLPAMVVSAPLQLQVKGFAAPITVHRFERLDDASMVSLAESDVPEFFHPSYQHILDRCRESFRGQVRRAILVRGNHGTGKSLVLNSCRQMVDEHVLISLDARQSIFFGPGYLARKLLTGLASQSQVAAAGLDQWVGKAFADQPLAVLRGVLDLSVEDDVWTRDLSPQLRASLAKELFLQIVRQLIEKHVIIVIDDLDRADSFSRQLLLALCATVGEIDVTLLVSATDTTPFAAEWTPNPADLLELRSPSETEWREYCGGRFADGLREEEFTTQLMAQSDRLPATAFELIRDHLAAGELTSNPVSGKWELTRSASGLAVTHAIRDRHLERFDVLPEELRTILKITAVIPTEFSSEMITIVSGESSTEKVEAALAELSARGLLRHDSASRSYQFASQSMKEAIYACIPQADLATWHLRSAHWLERHEPSLIPLLAYHFTCARSVAKGLTYSLKAAQTALAMYALGDAARHFESCRSLLTLSEQAPTSQAQVI